jgi:hypothetical protein
MLIFSPYYFVMKFCGSFVKDVNAVPWYVGMNYNSCFDVIVLRVCFMGANQCCLSDRIFIIKYLRFNICF